MKARSKLAITVLTFAAAVAGPVQADFRHHGERAKPAAGRQLAHAKVACPQQRSNVHFQYQLDQRQDRQQARIERGVHHGDLTRKEAKRLWRQQRRIAQLERQFRADGRYSDYERAVLQDRLDAASANIRFKRQNERRSRRS